MGYDITDPQKENEPVLVFDNTKIMNAKFLNQNKTVGE